jgi:type I restriction enzyme R subunit
VVRKILKDASENGTGKTYLIQHSAGSGKSNSITWAAYQLIECYPTNETVHGNKGLSQPLFDSVIVVTDRTILDKQLRDNIKEFSQVKNIVTPAFSSQELRSNLESGKKIIITTIQKFPFIINDISDLSDKRFAVIIDEAHSSQSGSAADNMNRAMGKKDVEDSEEEIDTQDLILEAMRSRKMRGNASYLAFTATPKNTTLEKFGVQQSDGTFKPFHLYSMKQAIQEGFILDVLANYTTFKSYYELEKSIEDNPIFDTKKAQKKLKAYVERHNQTIQIKAEVMVEHFINHVVVPKKLKGKGKAMVVTQDIQAAISYFQAIQRILKDKNSSFKAVIAFSGKKTVNGIEYTEDSLNTFAGKDIKENFDKDEYKILVVANKFLTGFDQPKLCTMYIDKKLQGVLAVQALSRLNRSANSLGKRVEDLFILDFFNTTEDIKDAFDPFYTSTTLNGATDVGVLTELKTELDEVAVYEWEEVTDFTEQYFKNVDAQLLSSIIDKAAERFNETLGLEPEEKADFKIKAKQFVKIYGQVAAIMPFEKLTWEQLYWFLKFLIPKLIIKNPQDDEVDELLNNIDLSTYGLQRTKLSHTIDLDDAESILSPQNSNPRGVHEKEEDPLDLIIRSFNEKWFQGWDSTPEDQRIKLVSIARLVQEHVNFKSHFIDNPDIQNRELALMKMISDVISQQRKTELEMYKRYSQDESFRKAIQDSIRRLVELR